MTRLEKVTHVHRAVFVLQALCKADGALYSAWACGVESLETSELDNCIVDHNSQLIYKLKRKK